MISSENADIAFTMSNPNSGANPVYTSRGSQKASRQPPPQAPVPTNDLNHQDRVSLKCGLTVALIGPEDQSRKAVAEALAGPQVGVIREYSAYPDLEDVPRLEGDDFDIIIVDLESNPDYALELVRSICCNSSSSVMVYSGRADSDMLVRCMRAGAREFLTQPFTPSLLAEALVRASVRRPTVRLPKSVAGKLLVFVGAKGGSGVTTVATNFALSLARESGKNTILIDMALPLGDVAIDLGITAQYSTAYALQNFKRLDSNFLSTLLVRHRSGLSVLAAPDEYTPLQTSDEAVDRLVAVSREGFDYVVIDAGSRLGLGAKGLLDVATVVYLVTQVNIPELRNSNRLIAEFFKSDSPKLEIVLNRFTSRSLGIGEEHVTNALTRPARWKVPNDYFVAQRAQNTASPLALGDSPISRVVRQMARSACGLPANIEKKSRFSLFG
jgi:pilus assembly protein CpaE